MSRRRALLAASMQSGGGKIENKLSYSIGALEKVTLTFQYPVESNLEIWFTDEKATSASGSQTISKGSTSIKTYNAPVFNDKIFIYKIEPREDDTYIYTW